MARRNQLAFRLFSLLCVVTLFSSAAFADKPSPFACHLNSCCPGGQPCPASPPAAAAMKMDSSPAFLDPLYGAHPVGGVIFIRFRPRSEH